MGAPMTLVLQTSRPAGKTDCSRIFNASRSRILTHPVPVWFLYYFSMFAFFLTFALGFAMNHMWVMDLINLGFLVRCDAVLVADRRPRPDPALADEPRARMVNLLIGVPLESFLALALLNNSPPAASMYPWPAPTRGRRSSGSAPSCSPSSP